jgi:hypothetical protein
MKKPKKDLQRPKDSKLMTYSKTWLSVIIVFVFGLNIWYFGITSISSARWLTISDGALEYASEIVRVLDTGVIVAFCGYLLKSIYETKWQEETRIKEERMGMEETEEPNGPDPDGPGEQHKGEDHE